MGYLAASKQLIQTVNPRTLSFLALPFVVAGIIGISVWAPIHNWDMLPYTIITISDDQRDVEENHFRSWRLIETRVTEEKLQELKQKTEHRRKMSDNPKILQGFLPMWEIKAGYVFTLRALNKYVDPVTAMRVISASSAIAITFLLFIVALRTNGWWTLIWIPIVGFLEIFRLARLLTPDSLTTLIYLAGILLLLRKRLSIASIFFLLGLIVRPDNLFLNLGMVAVFATLSLKPAVFLLFGSMSIYLSLTHITGHSGWWPHFYFTFVEKTSPPVNFDLGINLILYIKVLALNLAKIVYEGSIFLAAFLAAIFSVKIREGSHSSFLKLAAIVLIATAGIKFLVFPFPDLRVYAPHFYGLGAVLIFMLSKPTKATQNYYS